MDAIEYLYKLVVENNCDISCFKIKTFEENKMHLYRIEDEKIKIMYLINFWIYGFCVTYILLEPFINW